MVSFLLCEPFKEGGSAMQVYEAVKIWLEHHNTNSREKTIRTYRTIFAKFRDEFGERNLEDLNSEEILSCIFLLPPATSGRIENQYRDRPS